MANSTHTLGKAYDLRGKRIWVAGHRGMVGSAVVRRLGRESCEVLVADRDKVDLISQASVDAWMASAKPDAIVMAAAKVGGIMANSTMPAEFLYRNLMIEANITHAAHGAKVEKMLFLGSSCIYPKLAAQPIVESSLLTGPLEPTNEWYAVAKIAGIKLAEAYRRQYGDDFVSAMPTNLYGPGDNYDLQSSHVIPALIRKAHLAKINGDKAMILWGTGTPMREFLHADDCADALVHVLKVYSEHEHINVGSGEDQSIIEVAKLVAAVVGFTGKIEHDLTKPDGTPRKLMSGDKLRALGWRPRISLRDGLKDAYRAFLERPDADQ
jgi:GDP-L-fucose synthase